MGRRVGSRRKRRREAEKAEERVRKEHEALRAAKRAVADQERAVADQAHKALWEEKAAKAKELRKPLIERAASLGASVTFIGQFGHFHLSSEPVFLITEEGLRKLCQVEQS